MLIFKLIRQIFLARGLLNGLKMSNQGVESIFDRYAIQYASLYPLISEIYFQKLYKKNPSLESRKIATFIMALDPYLEYIFETTNESNNSSIEKIRDFLNSERNNIDKNLIQSQTDLRIYFLCQNILLNLNLQKTKYFKQLALEVLNSLDYSIKQKNIELKEFFREYSYPIISLYKPYNWKMKDSEINGLQNLAIIIQLFDDVTDSKRNKVEDRSTIFWNNLTSEEFLQTIKDHYTNAINCFVENGFGKKESKQYINFILRLGAIRLGILTRHPKINIFDVIIVLIDPKYLLNIISRVRNKEITNSLIDLISK